MILAIEWTAAAFAVLGTVLLALRGPLAGWGFVASGGLGIWVWLLRPRLPLFRAVYQATRPYRGVIAAARVALRCSR